MEAPSTVAALLLVVAAPTTGCVGAIGGAEVAPEPSVDTAAAPPAETGPAAVTLSGIASGPGAERLSPEAPSGDGDPALESTSLRGCPEGVFSCDDFEDGSLDGWEETTREGASVGVEDGALRLDLPAADGARALLTTRPFGELGESFWARFHVRSEAGVDMVHSYLLNAVGTLDGSRAYYGLHSNAGRLNSRYVASHVEDHGGWRKIGGHRLPSEWTCVELHFDTVRGAMSFFFDGEEDLEMRVDETDSPPWTGPELERIDLGFHTYQAAGRPFSVWYDGVALDSSRIGCD